MNGLHFTVLKFVSAVGIGHDRWHIDVAVATSGALWAVRRAILDCSPWTHDAASTNQGTVRTNRMAL
jgi:hypothetical protein